MSLLPNLDEMTDNEKLAVLESIQKSIAESKELQKKKIGENVNLVVQALKKIESDIRDRFDSVGNSIEKRVLSIKDGRDGINGKDGRDGKDGRNGKDGLKGDKGDTGSAGRDGVDGVDGVSVVNANIDFDGSLVITLSTGQQINVGEVVSQDVVEKLKIITSGGAGGGGGGGSGTVSSIATGTGLTGGTITTTGTIALANTAVTAGSYTTANITVDAQGRITAAANGSGGGSGTVTSVTGTGTVNGLTLSGTVTTSGNLTLGGSITGFATSGVNTNLTSVALTSGTITTTPTTGNDIVNKTYADAIASGIHFHEAVSLATTAALPANTYNNGTSGVGATLTANANGALSVDSTLTIVAERILVKNEAAGANNGVYVVTQVGSAGAPYILTRATDFDTVGTGVDQIDEGDFFLVTNGVANLNTAWVQQTPPPITIGTTAIVFQQFSAPITYSAGTGLNESPSYTFNIANTGTAGTYGGAASVPVFTTNAKGQVTSVTNTGIAIASGAVSGLAASATTDTTNAANITTGTLGTSRLSGSYTGITGTGALAAGSLAAGFTAVSAPLGGTGITSYAVGDIVYANTTTSLAKLPDVAVGNALISGGVNAAPSYGKIGLATHVDGTLPVANGGTGQASASAAFNALSPITTAGDLILGNGTNSATRLPIGTNTYVLTSNGTTASWGPPSAGSMIYPSGTGIAVVTSGTSWGTTLTAPSGAVVGTTDTQELTNKRVTPRVLASTANSATPTINTDLYDIVVITNQSATITNFSTNLSGTPTNGQKLWISITGTAAVGITTWGTSFESSTVTLPTTTVLTIRLDVGFVWNVATSKWRCVAQA